jgi:ribosomal protein S15P/S13E
MRKAKMVMEKAVKYSEKEGSGKVSYRSLTKALTEMKVHLRIAEKDVEKMQRPERILAQALSIGTPLEKRVRENIASLQRRVQVKRAWLALQRRRIEKAKDMLFQMEKELSSRA